MRGQSDTRPGLPLDRFANPAAYRSLPGGAVQAYAHLLRRRDSATSSPNFAGVYLACRRIAAATTCASYRSTICRFLDGQQRAGDDPRVRAGDYPARRLPAALASEDAVREEDALASFDVVFLRYNPLREGAATRPRR
jgi:hypothetical protein